MKTYIYILIILECRLSLKEASEVFHIPEKELEKEVLDYTNKNKTLELKQAIEYLWYYEVFEVKENARGVFKANLYMRRFSCIRRIKDKEERMHQFQDFLKILQGPDIHFIEKKKFGQNYSEKERLTLLKYHLKYAKSLDKIGVDQEMLRMGIKNLPDGELKLRLQALREYLDILFKQRRGFYRK